MRRQRKDHREASIIYRATVTDLPTAMPAGRQGQADTISHAQIGRFTFSAESIQEARARGWRIAGQRFGNGIDVRIERLSK